MKKNNIGYILGFIILILLDSCGDHSKKTTIPAGMENNKDLENPLYKEFISQYGFNNQKLLLKDNRDYLIFDSLEEVTVELGNLKANNIWLSISQGQGKVIFDEAKGKFEIQVYRPIDSALFNIRIKLSDSLVVNYGNFKFPIRRISS